MRLSTETLDTLPTASTVTKPRYDREKTDIGIVHIGPGAFHRAHQAVYTESVMNQSGGHWGICGVSLRDSTARDTLSQQDYLYTVATLGKSASHQIIGAIKELLFAPEQQAAVFTRLAASTTKIVSLTITEKGYCLTSDGSLDTEHPDIVADLKNPRQPKSAIGYLVEGLRLRWASKSPPFSVLSCDNISANGDKLRIAACDYAQHINQDLAGWIFSNVAFPNSMVDCITPKTEDELIAGVSEAIGAADNWPIGREEFSQWVIDSNWHGERPNWEDAGVVFTSNVAGFEKSKLRLLNGLHSTLAYAGSLAGFDTVYEAASDTRFRNFIAQLASEEIIGSFVAPKELNLHTYSEETIARFLNPEIKHLLSQIAWDGSQKIQVRLLPVIRDNIRLQRPTVQLCTSLACWFEFICRALKAGDSIEDPMAAVFADIPALSHEDAAIVVQGFLAITAVFGNDLANNSRVVNQLTNSLQTLRECASNGQPLGRALSMLQPGQQ